MENVSTMERGEDGRAIIKERNGSYIHFVDSGGIELNSDALAHNLGGVDQILQNGIMYSSQGAAHGPLLPLLSVLLANDGQNSPVGNEKHMLTTELLLKLAHKAGLDLVESLEETVGNEDEDGALAATKLDLAGTTDVELSEISLQLGGIDLQIKEGLSNRELKLCWLSVLFLQDFSASGVHDEY